MNEQSRDTILFFWTIFIITISFVNYSAYHLFHIIYQDDTSLNEEISIN